MKIFKLFTRKFESRATSVDAIETWLVEWPSLIKNIINNGEQKIRIQAFITKGDANMFASELDSARKLLGDEGFQSKVYKQKEFRND